MSKKDYGILVNKFIHPENDPWYKRSQELLAGEVADGIGSDLRKLFSKGQTLEEIGQQTVKAAIMDTLKDLLAVHTVDAYNIKVSMHGTEMTVSMTMPFQYGRDLELDANGDLPMLDFFGRPIPQVKKVEVIDRRKKGSKPRG